jgi:Na+-translocating ferredoxin:NAD+ oxidoreductase RnfG subunit
MIKPLVSLTAIALVCATLLTLVRAQTAAAIVANRLAAEWQIVFDVAGRAFPVDGLTVPVADLVVDDRSIVWFDAAGYGGPIEMLAALEPDGAIARVAVVRHRETPGLGDFVAGPWLARFERTDPAAVDGVTGATVTSEAVRRTLASLGARRSSEPSP